MTNDVPEARLLDLSRLVSRAGRRPTGIDRVERAYLDAFLESDVPLWGLVRSPLGYLLLDDTGLRKLAEKIDGKQPWGESSRFIDVFSKLGKDHKRALSDARRLSVARTMRRRLGRMLKKHLPARTSYVNVGHSNLTDFVTAGVKALRGARIAVMVHDTIPLDHPEFQRPESIRSFELFLKRVSTSANVVIYNSGETQRSAEAKMAEYGRIPNGVVAHLGVELDKPDYGALPKNMPPERPYLLCVSTLEPRKNHNFLLTLWEQMEKQTPPQKMPELVLCGQRGWMNDEFFFRLDNSRLKGDLVHELSDLSDGAISALLEGAAGVVFPSEAEGYGLPVMEAAAAGVPIICAELPVYREVLGDIPVYASINDSYLWIRRIMALVEAGKTRLDPFKVPTWKEHFNLVLSEL